MSEATSNLEYAHKIHELGHHSGPHRFKWVEIVEAAVLAVVAISTAWSGYQAAKWDALSTKNYLTSTTLAVAAQGKTAAAGQDRLYDITTFDAWVNAKVLEKEKLAAFFERRFRPEYAVAFAAWMKLDPIHNPSAPPGPIFMPEYKDANVAEAAKLSEESAVAFEKGVSMREIGDNYVRITVFLATVLLLTALSQRFHLRGPRVAVVMIAFVLLAISTYWIATYPRA